MRLKVKCKSCPKFFGFKFEFSSILPLAPPRVQTYLTFICEYFSLRFKLKSIISILCCNCFEVEVWISAREVEWKMHWERFGESANLEKEMNVSWATALTRFVHSYRRLFMPKHEDDHNERIWRRKTRGWVNPKPKPVQYCDRCLPVVRMRLVPTKAMPVFSKWFWWRRLWWWGWQWFFENLDLRNHNPRVINAEDGVTLRYPLHGNRLLTNKSYIKRFSRFSYYHCSLARNN